MSEFETKTYGITYPKDSETLWRWYADTAEVVGNLDATISLRGRTMLIVTTERRWTKERITEFFAEREMTVVVGEIIVTEQDVQAAEDTAELLVARTCDECGDADAEHRITERDVTTFVCGTCNKERATGEAETPETLSAV